MTFSRTTTRLIFLLLTILLTNGQTFVKDDDHIINQTNKAVNYSGPAWIDFDNDGDLDLHAPQEHIFINDGNGNFTATEDLIEGTASGIANGVSWADYNNDGILDMALAGVRINLYKGNGSDFTRITDGVFDPANGYEGWATAWGDYNNDGFVDLVVTHANGFHSGSRWPAFLFVNNGDGRFTRNQDFYFTQELAPYTIPTWTDYDMDGDLDLFIGSGPANGTPARDYIFVNQLMETGTANLVRLDEGLLGTEVQDGQTYNTVDFDNDGDLDVHLTNYSAAPDRFYINNDGSYESTQTPFTINGGRLAGNWGDTDNDGDLDLVVTSESSTAFYRNNGDGTFTKIDDNGLNLGTSRGASFGDYDDDGDLDIFIVGTGGGFLTNENDNGNSYIKFDLEGTVSNNAAIGAKVKLKATINGEETWQMREILAANSFGGHNSLQVHFGLGDATTAEELIVEWPSGQVTEMSNLAVNETHDITEEIPSGYLRANFSADQVSDFGELTVQFTDLTYSDTNDTPTSWEWDFDNDGTIDAEEQNTQFTYDEVGTYTVSLTVTNSSGSETITRENYIEVKVLPGIPIIVESYPTTQDTLIGKSGSVDFEVVAEDTTGYDLTYVWSKNGTSASTSATYNYTSSFIFPTPRVDTVTVTVSNPLNSTTRTWYVEVVDDPTSVEEEGLPTTYSLEQNYPNPFNPSTKIKYAVPSRSFVSIKVFDILGNEIGTLVNKEKSAGYYEANWNAKNLATGIYFYTIKAEKFTDTKKMLLIK